MSISKDGKRIASGSDDKTVKIWDAEELEELITLQVSAHVCVCMCVCMYICVCVCGHIEPRLQVREWY